MKKLFLILSTVLMTGLSAQADVPWKEVAFATVAAEQPTYRNIGITNNRQDFSEVRVLVQSTGVRIQRAEVVTDERMSLPVWHLEGDYSLNAEVTDTFEKSKIIAVRMYITTLQPGEPVQIRIFMR
ncbi:hypothetical protein [uncultured Bdellovibrio sp.]|uniref:hypothetical protein n=1 Tax=Bdellovibrio sp. HCB-162 TaxID=3394234 RepID=UPI0025CD794E|nr:hypothetical protein [uncultured Bdellovibrio sp.]